MWFGPVVVEIWPFQISNTIATVLYLSLAQVEFHSNCIIFGYIWSYKQRFICKYHVWVWNNSHTSLFPTIPSWDPFLLLRGTPSTLLLDVGQSAHSIASATDLHVSTISRLHSKEHFELQKATGDHPSKLSSANIHHAIHLISSGKAENAVQVTKDRKSVV